MSDARFEFDTVESFNASGDAAAVAIRMLLADGPVVLTIKPMGEICTRKCRALYWVWMAAMAKHFSKKGGHFEKEDMHDLMRHKFLGYESKTIGKTKLEPQLVSTSEDAGFSTAQMLEFMQQIDAWAANNGCLLPRPEDNEYAEYAKAAA